MHNYGHQVAGSLIFLSIFGAVSGCGSSGAQTEEEEQPRFVVVNDGPEGNSGLLIGSQRYPLDSALGDIWGVADDHYQIDFTLTDGNFMIDTIVVDGQSHQVLVPALATAIFHAEMYSAGDSFHYGSYTFVPSDQVENVSAGVGYFTNAFVGVDTNLDGMVTDEERYAVIEGVVNFDGSLPDITLNFSVTLSNGQTVTGDYSGLYDFTER